MERKTEEELNKYFEEILFSQNDIEYVATQVNNYLPLLYAHECSYKNSNKLWEIKKAIENTQNLETKKLFKEFEKELTNSIEQQNCLAYYIGLKKNLDLGNFIKNTENNKLNHT